jgi:hypothetical protein
MKCRRLFTFSSFRRLFEQGDSTFARCAAFGQIKLPQMIERDR